ncbi:MAG TPA: metallophosphoesterase [Candidatus Binatia bacterium]|jgi:Icc-related predicted phosphoesterase
MDEKKIVRVAATADIHCKKDSRDSLQKLFAQLGTDVDILLLGGDLCDTGLPEEAQIFAHELKGLRIPVLAVLGNHDYESGKAAEVEAILCEAGAQVLCGGAREIYGVGFAGVKGFCGGFGDRALQAWGEQAIKAFVYEGVEESLKLESALAKLRTPKRIALLHYAPVVSTIVGEPPEIAPFLGSSRLEEPLNHYAVTAVFHGHAHRGAPEGTTTQGIPVYNVAKPLLERKFADRPPFKILEIDPEPGRDNIGDEQPHA